MGRGGDLGAAIAGGNVRASTGKSEGAADGDSSVATHGNRAAAAPWGAFHGAKTTGGDIRA